MLFEQHHFELSGHDNGGFFYDGTDVDACPTCGLVNDDEWANPAFRVKRRKFDFSYTYDGAPIASNRLAEALTSWPGVRLTRLPADPDFYLVVVDEVVPLDRSRSGIRESHWCETCSRFRMVAGPRRACLQPNTVVPDGLSRTDAVFGSTPMPYERYRKTAQSPNLITTESRVNELNLGNFRGLVIRVAECDLDEAE